jgi:hypothetical protein
MAACATAGANAIAKPSVARPNRLSRIVIPFSLPAHHGEVM